MEQFKRIFILLFVLNFDAGNCESSGEELNGILQELQDDLESLIEDFPFSQDELLTTNEADLFPDELTFLSKKFPIIGPDDNKGKGIYTNSKHFRSSSNDKDDFKKVITRRSIDISGKLIASGKTPSGIFRKNPVHPSNKPTPKRLQADNRSTRNKRKSMTKYENSHNLSKPKVVRSDFLHKRSVPKENYKSFVRNSSYLTGVPGKTGYQHLSTSPVRTTDTRNSGHVASYSTRNVVLPQTDVGKKFHTEKMNNDNAITITYNRSSEVPVKNVSEGKIGDNIKCVNRKRRATLDNLENFRNVKIRSSRPTSKTFLKAISNSVTENLVNKPRDFQMTTATSEKIKNFTTLDHLIDVANNILKEENIEHDRERLKRNPHLSEIKNMQKRRESSILNDVLLGNESPRHRSEFSSKTETPEFTNDVSWLWMPKKENQVDIEVTTNKIKEEKIEHERGRLKRYPHLSEIRNMRKGRESSILNDILLGNESPRHRSEFSSKTETPEFTPDDYRFWMKVKEIQGDIEGAGAQIFKDLVSTMASSYSTEDYSNNPMNNIKSMLEKLKIADQEVKYQKTNEKENEKNTSDSETYYYTITLPTFFGLLIAIAVFCVIMRTGGWCCNLLKEQPKSTSNEHLEEEVNLQPRNDVVGDHEPNNQSKLQMIV